VIPLRAIHHGAQTSGARLGLVLLGGFAARVAPSGRPLSLSLKKARAILACLALAPGGTRPRQTLTGLLWPEAGEAEARNNFRVTLSSLRTALAAAQLRCLHIDGDTVLLDLDMVDVDTVTLRRLVENGSPDALTEAIRIYRGDLLAGLDLDEAPFEEWLVGEGEQLRILALGACEKILDHQLRTDADEAALASAMRLLSLDPLRDSVHATVMRLHAKHGRFGPALRQYKRMCSGPSARSRRRPGASDPPALRGNSAIGYRGPRWPAASWCGCSGTHGVVATDGAGAPRRASR